jgi:UDP-N-acetylmuramoyl-tripeptide--D-alanyl-D-alanine ligase
MISLTVNELVKQVKGELVNSKAEFLQREFRGVSIDSRMVTPGNLFVALTGENQDGHDFVSEAVNKTAAAVLVQKDRLKKIDLNQIAQAALIQVDDTRIALQELAYHYRRKFDLPVIGITGSNGKTTTKEMIAQVLETKYRVLKSQKSFNTLIGVPLTIFELSSQTEILVLELGTSQFGEIYKLSELAQPNLAVFLNIAPAHLENFGSLENVAKAKFELLEKLPGDKPVFINFDDQILRQRAAIEKHKVISYAIDNPADYQALNVIISGNGHLDFKVKENSLRLNLLGRHNVYNALAAYAVGDYFKLSPQQISQALQSYHPAHLRMEIQEIRGAKIINDSYNANPASMLAALEALAVSRTSGRRIAVLGEMLELGEKSAELHQEVGQKIPQLKIDLLITVGDQAENLARGAVKNGMPAGAIRSLEDKKRAARYLLSLIKPGDTVLLKGSRGMKMEEILKWLLPKESKEN